MSDPFPVPEAPAPEPRTTTPAEPTAALAKYADPSLARTRATQPASVGRSAVEWVRPAEIARRGSIGLASGSLGLGRWLAGIRNVGLDLGVERARAALRSRRAALTTRQRARRDPPDAPTLPGPGL